MFVLNKDEQVYLIITQDRMLFEGISSLVGAKNCIHICQERDVCLRQQHNAVVVIDTLLNNVLYSPLIERVINLKPVKIIILSPFGIRRLFPTCPVIFISRNVLPEEFYRVVVKGEEVRRPTLYFTKKQHQIVTLLLRMKNVIHITEIMGVTQKTLATHQYNIMLLMKLRKFSRVFTHPFADYLRHADDIQRD